MAEKNKLDACARKVKASIKVWPSARASQMVSKCRKAKGQVRKSESGTSLKRWEAEKWIDTRTGKPCGYDGKKKKEYCRPSKRVSSKTPKTASEVSSSTKRANQKRKSSGKRAKNA